MMKKRIFCLFLVFVMVTAMAAACSGKDETEGADNSNTESTVEEEDEQEDANRPPDEEEVTETAEPERQALTEEDVEALKASIKNAVIEEYIKPNGIAAADFSWPQGNSDAWYYFDLLKTNYVASKFMGTELEEPNFPDGSNKQIMNATFNGVTTWYESSGVDNYNYFESALHELSTEWITAIDFTAE